MALKKKGLLGAPSKGVVKKTATPGLTPKGTAPSVTKATVHQHKTPFDRNSAQHVNAVLATGKGRSKKPNNAPIQEEPQKKKAGSLFSSKPSDSQIKNFAGNKRTGKARGSGAAFAPPASLDAFTDKKVIAKRKSKVKAKRTAAAKPELAATLKALLPEFTDVAPSVAAALAPTNVGDAATTAPHVSNWDKMKDLVKAAAPPPVEKVLPERRFDRKRKQNAKLKAASEKIAADAMAGGVVDGKLVAKSKSLEHTHIVAMDCEMVGVGIEGKRNALARVCVVNDSGGVLLDVHVRPKEFVTDYRTKYSGIRPADLVDALEFEEAMQKVHSLVQGHVVVGHALHNDFKVLRLEGTVPPQDIRDTAVYPPLMSASAAGAKLRSRALRDVVKDQLELTIQGGEHSPVDDSRAALYIYQKHQHVWEAGLSSGAFKPRGLKSSGKIAKGSYRGMAMRAPAGQLPVATGTADTGVVDPDDEFQGPSADGVARMQAKMEGAVEDMYSDL